MHVNYTQVITMYIGVTACKITCSRSTATHSVCIMKTKHCVTLTVLDCTVIHLVFHLHASGTKELTSFLKPVYHLTVKVFLSC